MSKDINEAPFDDATKLKLQIFGDCFEEWLPVFINNSTVNKIVIFDLFAGSGTDTNGYYGSPLILLEKAKGKERAYCKSVTKEIKFVFNESIKKKSQELEQNIIKYFKNCKTNNNCSTCIYSFDVVNDKFKDLFDEEYLQEILSNTNIGKFILLDQYGFSNIDEDIFRQLIDFPKTDFIFFISSSFINRFKNHPITKKYIETSKINFEDIQPNEIHRAVASYFRDLIPMENEYYLHHFSIRKDPKKGNYYGLIFGSNHTLGMEKFLKVCWKKDPFSGEANYNIDNNFEEDTLFYDKENPIKKELIKKEIQEMITSGQIVDNISGFKYVMNKGCLPKLFTDVVKKMERDELIERYGELNFSSSNIHKVMTYYLKVRG